MNYNTVYFIQFIHMTSWLNFKGLDFLLFFIYAYCKERVNNACSLSKQSDKNSYLKVMKHGFSLI